MDLDHAAARDLTLRYALALGLVAVLTIAAQVVVQLALHRSRSDAEVVNLAGRQRMLSQRLCKAAVAWREAAGPGHVDRLGEARLVLGEWTTAHARLSAGSDLANAGVDNSVAVRAVFADLAPQVAAMTAATAALPDDPSAVDRLLAEEGPFLAGMERIVGLYRDEAAARVRWLISLELGLCLLLLLVLAGEALLVFRPAVRRLRQAIVDRERLAAQELEHRTLMVAADTARGIGQDLHDGLGQTLTALSFQAKACEHNGGGDTARAMVAGIGEAIAQCRAHARRLCPVDIQVAGLEAALRELAESASRAAGVRCTLEWAGTLPAAAGEDLYRIVQESITNALRHGKAQRIDIRVDGQSVQVEDDGVGGAAQGDGLGLHSMRLRCQRLGARLEVGPQPSGGWRVRVLLNPTPAATGAATPGADART